jgi:hypothetical protein
VVTIAGSIDSSAAAGLGSLAESAMAPAVSMTTTAPNTMNLNITLLGTLSRNEIWGDVNAGLNLTHFDVGSPE